MAPTISLEEIVAQFGNRAQRRAFLRSLRKKHSNKGTRNGVRLKVKRKK